MYFYQLFCLKYYTNILFIYELIYYNLSYILFINIHLYMLLLIYEYSVIIEWFLWSKIAYWTYCKSHPENIKLISKM